MPPEQASSYGQVDTRADIYALGGVAYFLLTGKPPFPETNIVKLIAAHAKQNVKPPSEIDSSIPIDLEAVILKCLSKKQSARYQNITSLLAAFENCECANGWTDQDAADWWEQNPVQEQPLPKTDSHYTDATVIYRADSEANLS